MVRKTAMKFPLLALGCALLAPSSHAAPVVAPAMQTIPVAPSYRAFAASDNLGTLSTATPDATRDKLGTPMSLMFNGTPKLEAETKNGYATMFATWAQTTLRVPLGWYAVDSNENVDESLIYSPDQTAKIVARAAMENQAFQSDRDAFAKLETVSVTQTRVRLEKMGYTVGPIEKVELPGEAFAIRAPQMTDKAGRQFSYIEQFSQRATKAQHDEYFDKRNAGQPLSPLQLPLSLSLLAPADKFDKYLPLLGLIARDEGLNWSLEQSLSPAEFAAKVQGAAQFNALADEAVALLKAGDVATFQARFPEAFEGEDKAKTADYLTKTVVPFFAKLPATIEREQITLLSDRDPLEPVLRATLERKFKLSDENFPSYIVAMDRVGGKIQLLGVATTDDEFAG